MKTVKAAHDALMEIMSNGDVWRWVWRPQDQTLQLRHCRKNDFTNEVAEEFLRKHCTAFRSFPLLICLPSAFAPLGNKRLPFYGLMCLGHPP